MRVHTLILRSATCAALLLAMTGCNTMNASDALLGAESGAFPDLRGHDAGGQMSMTSDEDATLHGLDRRHWPIVVIRAPNGQVEHQPFYFEPVTMASGPARNTDAAPNETTVLEGASDGGSLLAEAVVAPLIFAGELVILPVRAIFDPPWSVHRAPSARPARSAEAAPTQWRWVEPAP